jgi:WD40 repeat protein
MQLIWEDEKYILLLCCDAKSYYVYDEGDTECSELLRTVSGGHKDEITIIQYSDYLSLIATGSLDGEIVIWDFELSMVEAVLAGHKSDITALEFVEPYPLLVSASMDCTLCLWAVRPAPLATRYFCLTSYINISWRYTKDQETPITKVSIGTIKGITPH